MCQDVLRRVMEASGTTVHLVMGMTDVDDKILQRAQELRMPWLDLARHYETRFLQDMDAVGVRGCSRWRVARAGVLAGPRHDEDSLGRRL